MPGGYLNYGNIANGYGNVTGGVDWSSYDNLAANGDFANTDYSGKAKISGEAAGVAGTAGKVAGVAGGVMSGIGTATSMFKDINMSTNERMDDRGMVTHDVNWAGNIGGMAKAGFEIGSNFGPWGMLIGTAAGAIAGTVGSVVDSDNQPEHDDIRRMGEKFALGNQIQTIRGENTFAKQPVMQAEDGMDVKGDTKQIEVERDEIVLRKIGKMFKKVADFKGGKPHEMGGEPYTATEGDVIIPGKDRIKVNRMLKNRRWSAIESYRQALPTDVPSKQEFPTGTSGVTSGDPTKPKKGKRLDVYTYNPRMTQEEYDSRQGKDRYKNALKYYKNIEGNWYDTTFSAEFDRGKKNFESQYDTVNHVPVYDRDKLPDLIRDNPTSNVMLMDHSGKELFGSQTSAIGNALLDSKVENCYAGTCHGEMYTGSMGKRSPDTNIYTTPGEMKWNGLNPKKQGVEGMFPEGYIMSKGGKVVDSKYEQGTKEIMIGAKYAEGYTSNRYIGIKNT